MESLTDTVMAPQANPATFCVERRCPAGGTNVPLLERLWPELSRPFRLNLRQF